MVIKCKDGNSLCVDSLKQISIFNLDIDDSNRGNILYDVDEDKDDIVIKKAFFVAVVHYDVLNEFEIANIAVFIVDNLNNVNNNK